MRLYHISEEPDIRVFEPRPSPSHYDGITGNVVFAVSDRLMHNYLLPRDCPRVAYYANQKTAKDDIDEFIGNVDAQYIIHVESRWRDKIKQATLYCYELPGSTFSLLDETAGYYISYEKVLPLSVEIITDIQMEMRERNVELRFSPSLLEIADKVQRSSLSFSIIRMINAI